MIGYLATEIGLCCLQSFLISVSNSILGEVCRQKCSVACARYYRPVRVTHVENNAISIYYIGASLSMLVLSEKGGETW